MLRLQHIGQKVHYSAGDATIHRIVARLNPCHPIHPGDYEDLLACEVNFEQSDGKWFKAVFKVTPAYRESLGLS